jgi:hypothetical protein
MIKVKEVEGGRQVIDVNCTLITKVCDSLSTLEPVLFCIEKNNPELVENFMKTVNLIQEMHKAFLEADDENANR